MANREHFERPIRNGNGLLMPGSSVRLLQPGTTTDITDPIYIDATTTDERTNPWVTDNGVIDFYLKKSQFVRIGVVAAGGTGDEVFFEDIEVGNVDLAREVLAFTIAGPVSIQTGYIRLYVEADGEIERVRVSAGIAPVGHDIIVDVKLNNGASILPAPLHLPAGQNTAYLDLPSPVVVSTNDFLTVDVVDIGTTNTGSHLTVQNRMARY
jgi:hypothetical protein